MKSLVITGDSLSYNRYGYDEIPRNDAWNCHIGMQSWSFRLRNLFLTSAEGFKYADELQFEEENVSGLGENCNLQDAIFGERVKTIIPKNDKIHFSAESNNGKLVLYFQKRPKNYCRFKISVDGVCNENIIDTNGEDGFYQGWSILSIEVSCDKNRNLHDVVLFDFEYTEFTPLVTLAGVSCEAKNAAVTGQGSRTAKFINYHYDERIRKYNPDKLIIIFGGNDCIRYGTQEYKANLESILGKVKTDFPSCEILGITIPPSRLYTGDANGKRFTSQEAWNDYIDEYNAVFKETFKKYGAEIIETAKVFEGIPTEKWRFDEVHMTTFGNDLLFDAVCKKIF
ncbi:MAG: SGNH/GDSL hydrolase family protein [Ruminococcaceae bacterium]|nr:SGNH/GDSL hydrolase family protein [Oscillospiraceae bacterium]